MMEIPIKTNINDFFMKYLEVMTPVFKLKKREKHVLAAFLKIYYGNRNLAQSQLEDKLFSTPVKKMIRSSINMSEPSFNNHLLQLRAKKAIVGNSINPVLLKNLPTSKEVKINYIITLEDA